MTTETKPTLRELTIGMTRDQILDLVISKMDSMNKEFKKLEFELQEGHYK